MSNPRIWIAAFVAAQQEIAVRDRMAGGGYLPLLPTTIVEARHARRAHLVEPTDAMAERGAEGEVAHCWGQSKDGGCGEYTTPESCADIWRDMIDEALRSDG